MKKLLLGLVLVSLLVLTSCSLQDYIPKSSDVPVIHLNDSFRLNLSDSNKTINNGSDNFVENSSDNGEMNSSNSSDDLSNYLTTITVTEGDNISLKSLTAEDPDGDSITYTYSKPFDSDGFWATKDGDAGTYLVNVTASDGVLSTTETVRVIVKPSNKAPIINCPSNITVDEGDMINLDCSIVDPEGDNVSYTVSGFMDSLSYQTNFNDAGKHEVLITATDGHRESSDVVTVFVNDVNRLPIFTPIKPIVVTEGDLVKLNLNVSDPDGDKLTIEYPFVFNNSGVWKTKTGDVGNYDLEVSVSDGKGTIKIPVNITVKKLNLPPTIEGFNNLTVEEGDLINLTPKIVDEDGDSLSIVYSGFMNSSSYKTNFNDSGVYTETVTVSDGSHTVSKTITITVLNKNRPPVFIIN